jgi:hypothetical protein
MGAMVNSEHAFPVPIELPRGTNSSKRERDLSEGCMGGIAPNKLEISRTATENPFSIASTEKSSYDMSYFQ